MYLYGVWMSLGIAFDYILLNELQPLQRNADDVDADDDDNDDDGVEKTVNEGRFWLIWSVVAEFGALIMIDGKMSASNGQISV